MTSTDKMDIVVKDILRDIYAHCEPKLDFNKATSKGGKAMKDSGHTNWFCEHYISAEDEQAIIAKHMTANKLRTIDRKGIDWVLLDIGPTNNRECMLRERKEARVKAAKKTKLVSSKGLSSKAKKKV